MSLQRERARHRLPQYRRKAASGPDKMLQARIMCYADAHRCRIGVAAKLNLSHAGEQLAALAGLSLAELIAQTSAEAYTELQSTPDKSLARAAG